MILISSSSPDTCQCHFHYIYSATTPLRRMTTAIRRGFYCWIPLPNYTLHHLSVTLYVLCPLFCPEHPNSFLFLRVSPLHHHHHRYLFGHAESDNGFKIIPCCHNLSETRTRERTRAHKMMLKTGSGGGVSMKILDSDTINSELQ